MNSRHWPVVLLVMLSLVSTTRAAEPDVEQAKAIETLFGRDNLVAWCIVPYDAKQRTPVERAKLLKELGFRHFAYDWRKEHLPTFEQEIVALKEQGVQLTAVWFPAVLNEEAKAILAALEKHDCHVQLWVTMGVPDRYKGTDGEQVAAAVQRLTPIVEAATKIGCTVGLYNHGEWFGEPENQLAILAALKSKHAGIVYNLHHAHQQIERFPELLEKMQPHLYAINLNGMNPYKAMRGQKILTLGQGDKDLEILRTIAASKYRGPIGILGHTQDDAEQRLRDNLDGLDWLVPQLQGQSPGAWPTLRTPAMQ